MTHGALLLRPSRPHSQKLELADSRLGVSELQLREMDDPPSDSTSSQTQVSGQELAWSCPCSQPGPSPLGAVTGEGGGHTATPRPTFTASRGQVSALSVLLESSIVLKVLLGRGWRVTWETCEYLAYFMQEAFGVCCVGAGLGCSTSCQMCQRDFINIIPS